MEVKKEVREMKRKFVSSLLGCLVTIGMISGSLVVNAADDVVTSEEEVIEESSEENSEEGNEGLGGSGGSGVSGGGGEGTTSEGIESEGATSDGVISDGEPADEGSDENEGDMEEAEGPAEDAELEGEGEEEVAEDAELEVDGLLPDVANSVVTYEEAYVDVSDYIVEKMGINRSDYTLYAITKDNEWIPFTELEDGVGEALFSCWGTKAYEIETADGMVHVDNGNEIINVKNKTGYNFIIDWEHGILVRM